MTSPIHNEAAAAFKSVELEVPARHIEGVSEPVPANLTPKQIRRLRIKIDVHVIAFLSLIFAVSIVDRINIGSAKVLGMREDVGIDIDSRYSICLLVFFPGYVLSELPSNMLLLRLGVKKWISLTTFFFGLCVLGIGFAPNWRIIAFLRFFVGLFEGGIVPGAVFLISSCFGAVASAFAGLLANGIGRMSGLRGFLGWRWIFILEGAFTMMIALVASLFLSDFPDRATFLESEERKWVLHRLEGTGSIETEKLSIRSFITDSKDPWIFIVSLMYLCVIVPTYGLAFYLPTILTGFNHTGLQAALYSAPPYVAGLGMFIITGIVGDMLHSRGPLIIFLSTMTVAGLAIIQPSFNDNIRYAGLFLAVMGSIANGMTVLAYGQNNILGSSKRGVMTVWNLVGSSIGGILGSTIFRDKDSPTYGPGLYTTMAFQILLLIITALSMAVFHTRNRKADMAGEVLQCVTGWRYTL